MLGGEASSGDVVERDGREDAGIVDGVDHHDRDAAGAQARDPW